MKKDAVLKELETIRQQAGGLLRAEDVVRYAEDESTALHSCFTWDDGEAAHRYRLWEARTIIRVCVKTAPRKEIAPMRVFVSMESDRATPGGGYRAMVEVLSDEQRRAQLLEQATKEFERWEARYRHLTELAQVFAAMDTVRQSRRQDAGMVAVL